jgi:hypothetical protein
VLDLQNQVSGLGIAVVPLRLAGAQSTDMCVIVFGKDACRTWKCMIGSKSRSGSWKTLPQRGTNEVDVVFVNKNMIAQVFVFNTQ